MKFLLYNIRYAAGIGRLFHLPIPYSGYFKNTDGNLRKIIDFIVSINPDIMGLIEVDAGSFRSSKSNQAESIAWELQHNHIYKSKYSSTSVAQRVPLLNKQGNAILTNQAIVSQKFHYFHEGVKRLVIELEIAECIVFLVHLSIKFRHRHYQLEALHKMVEQATKPVIVAGDFNVLWGDRELQLFLAATGLESANSNGEPSTPADPPGGSLILFSTAPTFASPLLRYPRSSFRITRHWCVNLTSFIRNRPHWFGERFYC